MTIEEILNNFCGIVHSPMSVIYHNRTSDGIRTNLEENNVFRRILKISIDGEGNCEIPLLGIKNTINTIVVNTTPEEIYNRDFILPINSYESSYVNNRNNTYATPQILFSNLTGNQSSAGNICKKLYDKNKVKYYGAKGVVFNKDWVPIICITLKAKVKYIHPASYEHYLNNPYLQIRFFGINCYIEPYVITSKDTIEKFIVSKVLPYMANNKIQIFNRAFVYTDISKVSPTIIIKEGGCSKFFVKVNETETIVNDSINNFLINNISDISRDYIPEV